MKLFVTLLHNEQGIRLIRKQHNCKNTIKMHLEKNMIQSSYFI